jgi:type IV pilus assembly protein PilP
MMKARRFYSLGALLLSLVLIGCGESTPPPTPPAAPPKPAAQAPKPAEVAGAPAPIELKKDEPVAVFQYVPEGRRDPFKSIIISSAKRTANESLPPLQRRELSELKLIGVVWGGLGYGAVIQTPDGKGYPVRKGTRVGLNNGVISQITTKEIIVRENFLDIFGERKIREITLELHPQKEGLE